MHLLHIVYEAGSCSYSDLFVCHIITPANAQNLAKAFSVECGIYSVMRKNISTVAIAYIPTLNGLPKRLADVLKFDRAFVFLRSEQAFVKWHANTTCSTNSY